jgi:hypothetical protein
VLFNSITHSEYTPTHRGKGPFARPRSHTGGEFKTRNIGSKRTLKTCALTGVQNEKDAGNRSTWGKQAAAGLVMARGVEGKDAHLDKT